MTAVQVRSQEGPDALEVVDLPDPEAGLDPVLIEVYAAGVSFVDLLMSRGQYQERPPTPLIPAVEVSGVVRAAPDGGSAPGDRVAAYMLSGGYAELATAPANTTFRLPEQVDHRAGTALALNYQTAHFALVRRGHLAPGQAVLVLGTSGGIGAAAVQLAMALGATVVGVVRSADKIDTAVAGGADTAPVAENGWAAQARTIAPRGFSLVVDPVGQPIFDDSVRLLAPERRYLVAGCAGAGIPALKLNRILLRNVDIVGAGCGAVRGVDDGIVAAAATDLYRLIEAGAISPPVGRTYPFAQAAQALRDLEAHAATGKLVLEVGVGG